MKSPRKVSVGSWAFLTLSAVLAMASWECARCWPVDATAGKDELAALTTEREALRPFGDSTREELRKQRSGILQHAWTSEGIAALRESIGSGWRWEEKAEGQFDVRRNAPRLEEWADYARLVTMLADQPGLSVESVEIRAAGIGPDRTFTDVVFALRFLRADAPAGDSAQVPSDPRPVAPAELSAVSRKIGPGPQLRQASASFRPDPPGPSAGRPKEKPNQPMEKS